MFLVGYTYDQGRKWLSRFQKVDIFVYMFLESTHFYKDILKFIPKFSKNYENYSLLLYSK
jgi:hypothetical protein